MLGRHDEAKERDAAAESERQARQMALFDAYMTVMGTAAGQLVFANMRSKAQEPGLDAGERAGRGAMILHVLEMLDRAKEALK